MLKLGLCYDKILTDAYQHRLADCRDGQSIPLTTFRNFNTKKAPESSVLGMYEVLAQVLRYDQVRRHLHSIIVLQSMLQPTS